MRPRAHDRCHREIRDLDVTVVRDAGVAQASVRVHNCGRPLPWRTLRVVEHCEPAGGRARRVGAKACRRRRSKDASQADRGRPRHPRSGPRLDTRFDAHRWLRAASQALQELHGLFPPRTTTVPPEALGVVLRHRRCRRATRALRHRRHHHRLLRRDRCRHHSGRVSNGRVEGDRQPAPSSATHRPRFHQPPQPPNPRTARDMTTPTGPSTPTQNAKGRIVLGACGSSSS